MEKYETFSTTADVGIRIQGKGYKGLFLSALKGLNLLYFGDRAEKIAKPSRTHHFHFTFHGDSCENILVNLLSEISFIVQTYKRFVRDIVVKEASETYLNADLVTTPLDMEPEIEIKSVTYHNLRVTKKNDVLSAKVIFDV